MNKYFMETHHHEWILTNKLGAYALGTGSLINQRKYHGLLIAGDRNLNRTHLVAGIEEKVEWRGETIHLDSNNYSNCIYPEGFLHLVKPWLRPYPAFLYSALPHQDDILILKEIMMDESTNTTLLSYTNFGKHKLHFEFHPKYTLCQHHSVNPQSSLDYIDFDTDIKQEEGFSRFFARRKDNNIGVHTAVIRGEVSHNKYTYYDVYYPWEVMSGYEGIGDQITLFQILFQLAPNQTNHILFSDSPIKNPYKMIERIQSRYSKLPLASDYPDKNVSTELSLGDLNYDDDILFDRPQYLKILEFALMDFVSEDDVIAGYPFYGAWGRDTMVVLNALLHSNENNIATVSKILTKYSRHIRNGLIPNMFAETGRSANYDSIDATLWYIIMLWKLGKIKKSKAYWKEVICLSEDIFRCIISHDRHPFKIRKDGLIELDADFAYGTWMDVRIDEEAVTPRHGAPVEVNALWYNALRSYKAMCDVHTQMGGEHEPKQEYIALQDKILKGFEKFWDGEYLADRLEGDRAIKEIRPNAVVALSLPWPLVSEDVMRMVFERAHKELYTRYGLRTLSPKDPRFCKKHYGTQRERDLSYHNGSVWAWLLGPFCGLYLKIYRDQKSDTELAEELGGFIATLRNGFMRGHIASVAEVWDGEKPHFPKGAPAKAWSVAALHNVESFIESLGPES